ncbi:MAG: c-type cytochrome [Enterobacterales bacterium]|nr:c-type cytochrome [Enterobacterales bacterium]
MQITINLLVTTIFCFATLTSAESTLKHGEDLYKINCSACHGVNGGMDMEKRIAPPIIAVRMHYLHSYSDEMSFVDAIVSWVEQPNQDNTLMAGAVRRFGLMPKIAISKSDIEAIAEYVYRGKVGKPKGFDQHYKEMHGKKGKGKG